jgi:glycosyltransferase involved in cell wall biosynthesis
VLVRAWRAAGLGSNGEVLLVAGGDSGDLGRHPEQGMTSLGIQSPTQLRNLYAAADVLIMPSIRTRTFREPWGLVANEALNQRLAVIATDAVGAAAGGLLRHERNGLIVRAGNEADLAAAILRLRDDPDLRVSLGDAGARDVAAFTHNAWAAGFAAALRSVSASGEPC